MNGGWNKVNVALRKALTDVSLADMGTTLPFLGDAAEQRHAVGG
jgi:hypothetical protein